jgi:hypothetical protein
MPLAAHTIGSTLLRVITQLHARDVQSLDEVLAALPDLKWKREPAGEGEMAFTILGGDKATGEIHILAVLENCHAPKHFHVGYIGGIIYGELIFGIAGDLEDVRDDGTPITVRPGMMLVHGPATTHMPRAKFWVGYYCQPYGSRSA